MFWAIVGLCAACTGCGHHILRPAHTSEPTPTELTRTPLPPYVIHSPDILSIDALTLIPRPPYRIQSLDVLAIQVTDPATKGPLLPKEPISGYFSVTPEGTVDLGASYRSVMLAGLTLAEARKAIEEHLKKQFNPPFAITVELAQSRAMQQIRGEHLVRPDGTISLGSYGSVVVDGMTLAEAKFAIESYLASFLLNPQISLDVIGYNSQVYYVITDWFGSGQQVYRLPITGNETVLDAIANVQGLPVVGSRHHIWLSRPTQDKEEHEIKLAVDWNGITQHGRTATNYQILPGDRVFVKRAPLITTDTILARIISPMERILGIALLGHTTVNAFETRPGSSSTSP
jgi:polysaccharide export outer membrane protein